MNRYKITFTATLTVEVDAPREAAAMGAIETAFKAIRARDPLEGTRFTFDRTETECANPRLMTTIASPGSFEVELV